MLLLASLYEEHGVPTQAVTVLLGAQEACAAHPGNEKSLALVLHNLGLLHEDQNKLDDAVSSLEDAAEMQLTHFGAGHSVRASTLLDLAAVYLAQGRVNDSLRVGKAAMNARAGGMGGLLMSSPILADAMMALVPIFNAAQRYGESKAHIEKAIAIRCDFYGKEHTSLADCFVEYGMVCRYKGDYEKAKEYLEFGLKVIG
jgi:tetratricopeptide (TPR) repeat protein